MKRLWLLCVLCVLTGCGGGGSGGFASAEVQYRGFMSAVNREDLTATMNYYSGTYLNDCLNWIGMRLNWTDVFGQFGHEYKMSDFRLTLWTENGDSGLLEGVVRIVIKDNGVTTADQDVSVAASMVRENGIWRFYGNHQCN